MVYVKKADREKKIDVLEVEDPRFEALNKRIDQVLDVVSKVAEMIPRQDKVGNIDTTIESKLPPTLLKEDGKLPVPGKWREMINQILGPEFEAEVDESSGGNYVIKVYMPLHLDRRV